MESEKCKVLRKKDIRPSKRRRLEYDGLESSLEARKALFRETWKRQEALIDQVTNEAHSATLDRFERFFDETSDDQRGHKRVPVALILTEHGSSAQGGLFESIRKSIGKRENGLFVSVDASANQNLRAFMTSVNKAATSASVGDDDDEELAQAAAKGPRMLKYDLQILYEWCIARNIQKVTIAVPDGDGLDAGILNDLILLLRSWQDRLLFTLLLGISTPVDIFRDRLSFSTTHLMNAHLIDVEPSIEIVRRLFDAVVLDSKASVRIGPQLVHSLMSRQLETTRSTETFVSSLKYALMSHFYGNALSVLCTTGIPATTIDEIHCEAMKSLPSLQSHIEDLVESGETEKARSLLTSSTALLQHVQSELASSQSFIAWKLGVQSLLTAMHDKLKMPKPPSPSTLYIRNFSGELLQSSYLRELTLHLRKASIETLSQLAQEASDTLMSLPPSAVDASPDDFSDIVAQLAALPADGDAVPGRRRGADDTIKSQIITTFSNLLTSLFEQTLVPYTTIPLHELLIYDLKQPHNDALTPRIRPVLERALGAPNDYLGCACCADAASLRPTYPPTAILYQLYLESGALVNVHDLHAAFKAVLAGAVADEAKLMALFYRGLAELKALGFVKHSRKRVDHVAKVAWRGL